MRRGARKLALDLLYEHEVAGRPVEEIARRYEKNPGFEYASRVAGGVTAGLSQIDDQIRTLAKGWDLERMPVVDRSLLRIAIWEIQQAEVPPAVAINEAVELAKIYSTKDSPRFINGVLGKLPRAPVS